MENIFNKQIKEIFNNSECLSGTMETKDLNELLDEFVSIFLSQFHNLDDIGRSYVQIIAAFTAIQELDKRNEPYTKRMQSRWN